MCLVLVNFISRIWCRELAQSTVTDQGQGQSYLEISTVKRGTIIYGECLSTEFTENVAAAMNPVKLKHQRTHSQTHTHNPIPRFPWQPEQLLDGKVFVATLLLKDSGEGFHRRMC